MSFRPCVLCLFAALPGAIGHASWATLAAPPTSGIWAIQDDPSKGKGAIFLEKKVLLEMESVTYTYRILILADHGKRAAEFPSLSDWAKDIHGRVVYPDGRAVPFDSRKDFITRTVAQNGWGAKKGTVVVPPGLTDHCLVELQWRDIRGFLGGNAMEREGERSWALQEAFPVQESTVEVGDGFPWAWRLYDFGRNPEIQTRERSKLFVFKNLPPAERPPFSKACYAQDPYLKVFLQPSGLADVIRKGADKYWNTLALRFLKEEYTADLDRGWKFSAFSASLRSGLTGTPVEKAAMIYNRLQAKIRNLNAPTSVEAVLLEKDPKGVIGASNDLSDIIKRGGTMAKGMQMMLWSLLKDEGISTRLAFGVDKDRGFFNVNELNLQQFDRTLVGVPDGKGVFWMDPSLRFTPAGVISMDYQDTEVLEVDTNTWTARPVLLEAQPFSNISKCFSYDLSFEDGDMRFSVDGSFKGWAAVEERYRFIRLSPDMQDRSLKERFEATSRKVDRILKASVLNATDGTKDMGWRVEGLIEQDGGRRRVFNPFPLLTWPLAEPDAWPHARTEPIALSATGIQLASASYKVPQGYKVVVPAPLHRVNALGSVSWITEGGGTPDTPVKSVMRVDIKVQTAGPEAYQDLKDLVRWIKEASERVVVLEAKE